MYIGQVWFLAYTWTWPAERNILSQRGGGELTIPTRAFRQLLILENILLLQHCTKSDTIANLRARIKALPTNPHLFYLQLSKFFYNKKPIEKCILLEKIIFCVIITT